MEENQKENLHQSDEVQPKEEAGAKENTQEEVHAEQAEKESSEQAAHAEQAEKESSEQAVHVTPEQNQAARSTRKKFWSWPTAAVMAIILAFSCFGFYHAGYEEGLSSASNESQMSMEFQDDRGQMGRPEMNGDGQMTPPDQSGDGQSTPPDMNGSATEDSDASADTE